MEIFIKNPEINKWMKKSITEKDRDILIFGLRNHT